MGRCRGGKPTDASTGLHCVTTATTIAAKLSPRLCDLFSNRIATDNRGAMTGNDDYYQKVFILCKATFTPLDLLLVIQ